MNARSLEYSDLFHDLNVLTIVFYRFVEQDETIEFRSQANKYLKLLKTISDYLGISDFLQKYVSFYNDVISPTIFSYLPGGAKK